MRKGTILIAVAVITTTLAVLAGLIWFALQADSVRKVLNLSPKNTATEETNTNIVVTNTVTNTEVNTNTVIDAAAGWLTFTDTKGAYTAKYPSTYVAEQCNGGDDHFSVLPPGAASLCDGAYQGIFIEKRDTKTVAAAVTSIKTTATNPVETTATVSGLAATRLTWTDKPAMGGEGLSWDVYVVLAPKGVIEIANSDKAQTTTFTTFLANITFTASTADWKTYTNTSGGFSYKYPNNLTSSENGGYHVIGSIDTQFYMLMTKVLDRKLDSANLLTSFTLSGVSTAVTDATEVSVGNQKGYSYREGDAGCGGIAIQTALKNNKTLLICYPAPQATPSMNYWQSDLTQQAVQLSSFTFTK